MKLSCVHFEETKAFLTVQETARLLSLSEYTIYKMIHNQELPALQFGRRFKIKAEDIEEVMELLKIGRSTFYKLIQEGVLKGFKEGNRYKVPASSVEEYVKLRMDTLQ